MRVQEYRLRECAYRVYIFERSPAYRARQQEVFDPLLILHEAYGHILLTEYHFDVSLYIGYPSASSKLRRGFNYTSLARHVQRLLIERPRDGKREHMYHLLNLVWDDTLPCRNSAVRDSLRMGVEWYSYSPYVTFETSHVVSQCCFWTEPKGPKKHPMVSLFTKAMFQPCQSRILSSMIQDVTAYSYQYRCYLREIVMTSLMGQYAHSQVGSRLTLGQRDTLQAMCVNDPDSIDEMIKNSPWFTVFVLHERILFDVFDQPVLVDSIGRLCDIVKIQQIVHATMASARITLHESECFSPDGSVFDTVAASVVLEKVFHNDALHSKMLKQFYKRRRVLFIEALMKMCARKSEHFEIRVLEPVGEHEDPFQQLSEADAANLTERPWITFDVAFILYEMIRRLDKNTASLTDALFDRLSDLGVPIEAVKQMRAIELEFDVYRLGSRCVDTVFSDFKSRFPYSFYLMQVACVFWHRHSSLCVYGLPLHHVEHQLEAIASRFGIPKESGDIPLEQMYFRYCSVCRRRYGLCVTIPRHSDLGVCAWDASIEGTHHEQRIATRRLKKQHGIVCKPGPVNTQDRVNYMNSNAFMDKYMEQLHKHLTHVCSGVCVRVHAIISLIVWL